MYVEPPLHIRPLAQTVFRDHPNAKGSVLLIHGFADSPYSMRGLASVLYDAGFRVLVIRVPGHGAYLSDLGRTGLVDWQEGVRRGLAQLHAYRDPVAILGRSFGGVLALLACAENPHDADAVILLATPRLTRQQRLLRLVLPVIGLVRKTVPKPWVQPEERVMRYEVGRHVAFPIPALQEFFRALALLTPGFLTGIRTPVLILHGTDDRIAKPQSAQELYTLLGSVEKKLVLVPGVGHAPESLHTHADLQSAILEFLEQQLPHHRST